MLRFFRSPAPRPPANRPAARIVRQATAALLMALSAGGCDCEAMLASSRQGPVPVAPIEAEPPAAEARRDAAEASAVVPATPLPSAPGPSVAGPATATASEIPVAAELPAQAISGDAAPASPGVQPVVTQPMPRPLRPIRLPGGGKSFLPRGLEGAIVVPEAADAETKGKRWEQ